MKAKEHDKADYSWNPVTGCKKQCPHCQALPMLSRYSGDYRANMNHPACMGDKENGLLELEKAFVQNGKQIKYPFEHIPTLHKYLLDVPKELRLERNIWVCDLGDLFAEWIPDEWIKLVFNSCLENPQHNYLFLTSNPVRYEMLGQEERLPQAKNMWYGTKIIDSSQPYFSHEQYNTFLAIDPISSPIQLQKNHLVNWVLIGREIGRRRGMIKPKKEWILAIKEFCDYYQIPVFMRKNLEALVGEESFVQKRPEIFLQKISEIKAWNKTIGRCLMCGKQVPKKQMYTVVVNFPNSRKMKNLGHLCLTCYEKVEQTIEID